MNLLFSNPDKTVSVVHSITSIKDVDAYIHNLRLSGGIHPMAQLCGVDVELPTIKGFRDAWMWDESTGQVMIDFTKAQAITKDRLRADRAPYLQELDVAFMRALETGGDTQAIVVEKNRLRDITTMVDTCTTIEELIGLHV